MVQNKAGRFIAPSDRSGQAAFAANVKHMPENLRLFLPDPEGEESYPIASLSWLLLYEHYGDDEKRAALKRFLEWGLSQGQAQSRELGYVPLPPNVVSLSRTALDRIH